MRQLEEVAFIEQIYLDLVGCEELLDRLRAQGADPVDTVELAQHIHLLLGDHAAIAHQHEPLETELLAHLVDLRQQVFRIAAVALEH